MTNQVSDTRKWVQFKMDPPGKIYWSEIGEPKPFHRISKWNPFYWYLRWFLRLRDDE